MSSFFLLTFGLSLIAFGLMVFNAKWQTPENLEALPVWVVAVWSPTVSALIIWASQGKMLSNLRTSISIPEPSIWLILVFTPLAVMGLTLALHPPQEPVDLSKVPFSMIAVLLLLNLILGPLGEEAGWRGFLFPHLQERVGWMGAALLIGCIWTLWHAPLWAIASPQSEINFFIFTGHVFCYSLLMSILYLESDGSLLPVIGFHLFANVVSGYTLLLGSHSTPEFYRISLFYYLPATLLIAGIYQLTGKHTCSL